MESIIALWRPAAINMGKWGSWRNLLENLLTGCDWPRDEGLRSCLLSAKRSYSAWFLHFHTGSSSFFCAAFLPNTFHPPVNKTHQHLLRSPLWIKSTSLCFFTATTAARRHNGSTCFFLFCSKLPNELLKCHANSDIVVLLFQQLHWDE